MLRISAENKQVKLRKQLGKLIQSYQLGDRLPSEPVLAERYGVSRSTVRDVLTQLETEGFITRRQGSGTYISRMPINQDESLLYFMDFSTLIAKQGHTPNVQQLSFVKQKAGLFFPAGLIFQRMIRSLLADASIRLMSISVSCPRIHSRCHLSIMGNIIF